MSGQGYLDLDTAYLSPATDEGSSPDLWVQTGRITVNPLQQQPFDAFLSPYHCTPPFLQHVRRTSRDELFSGGSLSQEAPINTALLGINNEPESRYWTDGVGVQGSAIGAMPLTPAGSYSDTAYISDVAHSESLMDSRIYLSPSRIDTEIADSHQNLGDHRMAEALTAEALKKNSQQVKLMNRHTRPFKCAIPSCDFSTKGFATQNDRTRHMETRHSGYILGSHMYACPHSGCKNEYKTPRRDNFRRHLKMAHGIEDADLPHFIVPNVAKKHAVDVESSNGLENTVPISGSDVFSEISETNPLSGTENWFSFTMYDAADDWECVQRLPGIDRSPANSLSFSYVADFPTDDTDKSVGNYLHLGRSASLAGIHRSGMWQLEDRSAYGSPPETESGDQTNRAKRRKSIDSRYLLQGSVDEYGTSIDAYDFCDMESINAADYVPAEDDPEIVLVSHRQDQSLREDNKRKWDGDDSYNDIANNSVYGSDDGSNTVDGGGGGLVNAQPCASEKEPQCSLVAADAPQDILPEFLPEFLRMAAALKVSGQLRNAIEKVGFSLQPLDVDHPAQPVAQGGPLSSTCTSTSPATGLEAELRSQQPAKRYNCTEPGCDSSFTIQAALRKHTKRHDRPYSCTNQRCVKSASSSNEEMAKGFGSKGDWKRHEMSQHMQAFLVESWKCSERAAGGSGGGGGGGDGRRKNAGRALAQAPAPAYGAVCGQTFSDEVAFRDHLSTTHCINKTTTVAKRVRSARPPPMSQHVVRETLWFWCGFCKARIPEEATGGEGASSASAAAASVVVPYSEGKNSKGFSTKRLDARSRQRGGRGGGSRQAAQERWTSDDSNGTADDDLGPASSSWTGWSLGRRQRLVQQRFDHIDDHFMGREGPRMRIHSWVNGGYDDFGTSGAGRR